MTPTLPLIAIHNDSIDIIDGNYPLDKTNLLGLFRYSTNGCLYYDNDGQVWSSAIYSETHKPTFLNKLLANTFYNPTIAVQRSWTLLRSYELHELKRNICHCIDKDDDILTQFIEADNLKVKVVRCADFAGIISTLLMYVFQPDEEQINREFPVEE